MGIVTTIPEKCKRCYSCIRECPAKAIKVENGQAMVIEERCIACGNCVKVCAQNAKRIEDGTEAVRRLLSEQHPVAACLAPSFPAAFTSCTPGQVAAGCRRLGFRQVWEVAFGAELIGGEYAKRLRKGGGALISSPCPSIVAYVQKYLPALRPFLAPIVSPMIATARAVRHLCGGRIGVVFIGPCIAKKAERKDPDVRGEVDAVLTYEELARLFAERKLKLDALEEASFDSPPCLLGATFPISGGLLKTAGLEADILDKRILTTEGKERALPALHEQAKSGDTERFLDLLFCEGCINGPKMLNDLSVFARKEILAEATYRKRVCISPEEAKNGLDRCAGMDLSREFTDHPITLPEPSEEEIIGALKRMRKEKVSDQLNCGACGYITCREKAVAVCQGLAEPQMCLPYIVDELESSCRSLESSHRELAEAQARLVQSENLASMGQVSAGLAHEINNPLGTILLYAHLLLEKDGEERGDTRDLQMIVSEANRCRKIMRGLLDFARHSRISPAPASIERVIREVMEIMDRKAREAVVRLRAEVQAGIPVLRFDEDQIKQLLINLVQNGIDAIEDRGSVTVKARFDSGERILRLSVKDDGKGMPEGDLARLFTPFFTTREEGTGLGLAIAYGIVKMHSGDITVESDVGGGSRFIVTLPMKQENPPQENPVAAGDQRGRK